MIDNRIINGIKFIVAVTIVAMVLWAVVSHVYTDIDEKKYSVEMLLPGDTLYYTYTGDKVWKFVVLKNDTLSQIIVAKVENTVNKRFWYREYLTYEYVKDFCTLFRNR